MGTELGLRSTLFSLFYLVGIIVTLQIRSYHSLARIFHEFRLRRTATMDMGVPARYASKARRARPSSRSRDSNL